MIQQLKSTSHFLYAVTVTYVIQYDASTQDVVQRWDLPSVPRSDLKIASDNEEHWSIVCASHLRTHDMALPHGFVLDDAYGTVTFLSMHEIGVSLLPEDAEQEIRGIRLVSAPTSSSKENLDVYQNGTDVCVRRMERNGFMQRIANVQLLHDDPQQGIVVAQQHEKGMQLVLYDAYGRNPQPVYVLPDSIPLVQVRFAIVNKYMAVLGNVPSPGALYVNDPWRIWYLLKRALLILFVVGVLLSFCT